MSFLKVLFSTVVAAFCTVSPSLAQIPFTRSYAISESCRLCEEQRYTDAVTMAEKLKLCEPNDSDCLATSGAVALLVGAQSPASSIFGTALSLSPHNSLAIYGKSLLDLEQGDPVSALSLVSSIDISNLTPAALNDVSVVKAICLAETGNSDAALVQIKGSEDPAALEIQSLLLYRRCKIDTSGVNSFLQQTMVNGVPTVVEPPGLRLLLPASEKGAAVEPSITELSQSQDLSSRFDSSFIAGGAIPLTGQVTSSMIRPALPATYEVILTIDGELVGESTKRPYRFTWDSHSVENGLHTLTFTMTDANTGRLGVQIVSVYVLNLDTSNSAEPGSGLTHAQSDRLWNLLRIRPDYKVAEYELALGLLSAHDSGGYETHILRAAALDPDYRDVRARVRPLFMGIVPSKFPIPDGTSLPSSLGLSAGSASAAGFWAGSPHVREIALTFDDGPIPGPTEALLAALHTANARATFFVVGSRAVEAPDCLREMAAAGNAVEDHSFTHPNLTQILPQHIMLEILRTAVVIQATTGIWPHFLRPPGGNTNSLVLATAKFCGMSGAFWTIDALPAEESGSPQAVADWVIHRARPGAIVLMHNGMATTVSAIPALVQGLRQRGYKLVTIVQLASDALADRHSGT